MIPKTTVALLICSLVTATNMVGMERMSSTFPSLKTPQAAIDYAKRKIQEDPNRLYNACKDGDLEQVKLLAVAPEIINSKDPRGRTSLHWAASYGCLAPVKLLIEQGAIIDAQDNDGFTPLHMACQNGHIEVVRYLVAERADINAQDTTAWLQMDSECLYAYLLREAGAVIRVVPLDNGTETQWLQITGLSPLYIACQKGHKDIITFLIKCGAKIDACINYGFTPLDVACQNADPEIVACLLEHGASIDTQINAERAPLPLELTPFHWHCNVVHHKVEITKLLLFKSFFRILKASPSSTTSAQEQHWIDIINKENLSSTVPYIACTLVGSGAFQLFAHHAPLTLQQAVMDYWKEDNSPESIGKQMLLLGIHCNRHFTYLKNTLKGSASFVSKLRHAQKAQYKKHKQQLTPFFGHCPSDSELELWVDQVYTTPIPLLIILAQQLNNHETAALLNHIITTDNFDALNQNVQQAIANNIIDRLTLKQASSGSNRND